jgi:hypothetical protein
MKISIRTRLGVTIPLACIMVTGLLFAQPLPSQQVGDAGRELPDPALQPPRIITSPSDEYGKSNRGAQGVPGIERAPGGRLWAAWYTGKSRRGVESSTSYCVLATSADDGTTWTDVVLAIQTPPPVHTYDPCLWIDPQKRLWYFWAQSVAMQDGRMGVWAIVTDEPDAEQPKWSAPRRIANGIMLNKPTVLKNGDWLLPVGLWPGHPTMPNITFSDEALKPYTREMLSHDLGDERATNVYRSTDQGKTFERFGQARIPNTRHDEHMIVQRRDGSLWMLLRNTRGMAQAVSADGGRTWEERDLFMTGGKVAGKRFFVRRLQSGAILLVRNDAPSGAARTHLTAFLSDDGGGTWTNGLLLDQRESSYPDGVQAPDGVIYIVYDHQRYTLNRSGQEGVGGVMMASFTEADARAGRPTSDKARLRVVISQLR